MCVCGGDSEAEVPSFLRVIAMHVYTRACALIGECVYAYMA